MENSCDMFQVETHGKFSKWVSNKVFILYEFINNRHTQAPDTKLIDPTVRV